jgi:hypothetical protein
MKLKIKKYHTLYINNDLLDMLNRLNIRYKILDEKHITLSIMTIELNQKQMIKLFDLIDENSVYAVSFKYVPHQGDEFVFELVNHPIQQ